MAETWPSILIPTQVDFYLAPMVMYGASTVSGLRQAVGTDAGYWQATLSGFQLRTPDQIREWRALVTAGQGGLGDILIGPFDCRQAARHTDGSFPSTVPHSDDAYFGDFTGYSQSQIVADVATTALLRATSLTIDITGAGELRRGMYFSISERLYMITSVPVVSGAQATFSFLPPLRATATAGTEVEMAHPFATMRLAAGSTGRQAIRMGKWSEPSIDLVESFDGLS